jgi:hypothetical protein
MERAKRNREIHRNVVNWSEKIDLAKLCFGVTRQLPELDGEWSMSP